MKYIINKLLFLGKTICYNIIQFHALTGSDTTSYFYRVGQTISKNTNVLELISNLEQIVSANDNVIKNCKIFIQTVLYNGTSNRTYVETGLRLQTKQKTKNSISLPPDPLSSYSSSESSVVLLAALYR